MLRLTRNSEDDAQYYWGNWAQKCRVLGPRGSCAFQSAFMINAKPTAPAPRYSLPSRFVAAESWSATLAFVMTTLFFVAELFISAKTMFWFDEVFTTLSTRLPKWADMW